MRMGKRIRLNAMFAFVALILPTLLSAQVEETGVPATRTVSGHEIVHYRNGPSPVDLSAVTIAAYVPNGSGGYTLISGTGTSAGNFSISNVPTGSYVLQLGGTFLVTSNTVVDADSIADYRSNGVPANSSTTVTFDLANLEAWQNTDVFEMVCPNNAVFVEAYGNAGETSFTGTFSYAITPTTNLSDASQGDQYFITQLSTQNVGGFPFTGASRTFFPAKFTQAQGSDTPINGAFKSLPQTYEFEANINGADLTAQALAANPNAALVSTNLVLDAYPGSLSKGENTSTPDLVGYNLSYFNASPNLTTNADLGKVSYGNPYPASWPLFVIYAWFGQTNFQLPGTSSSFPLFTFEEGDNTALPTSTSPVKPLVGVVTTPTINGNDFFGNLTGVGLTPTLKWLPPSLGKATFYEVDVIQLSNVGGSTFETAFTSVRTPRTSLTIPPGLLSAGNGYAFVIRAWYTPGINVAKTPFMKGPVNASTDVISGLMQP